MELEVAHREMKSGFGVGEKQCWNPRSTIASVQWSVWVYALLLLSAYRTWDYWTLPHSHMLVAGCKALVFQYPLATISLCLLGTTQFQALWTRTSDNWLKKESFLIGLSNSSPLLFVSNTKRALAYPFRFLFRFTNFAQRAKVEVAFMLFSSC